jgi:hypothetical protein
MRALLAARLVLLTHEGEELVIALPVIMLIAAFFLMRYAAGGKSEDEPVQELAEPLPTFDGVRESVEVGSTGSR